MISEFQRSDSFQSSSCEDNKSLVNRSLVISIGIHFLLFFIIFLSGGLDQWLFSDSSKDLNIKVLQTSIRVDVVEMPRMTLQQLKAYKESPDQQEQSNQQEQPAAPTPIEKIQEINKEATDKNFIKQAKKKSFLDMIDNLSQKNIREKVKESAQKKDDKKDDKKVMFDSSVSQKLEKLVYAGNKVSQGIARVEQGEQGSYADAFERYLATIPDVVRPHWRLPSYLKDQNLRCRIRIFLNKDGVIVKTQIYESSGVDEYDSKALQAIKQASPFPVAEKQILSKLQSGDVILGFPL